MDWRRLHIARMEEGRSAFKILTGRVAGERPLGRPWRRWEDNVLFVCICFDRGVIAAQCTADF